MWKTLGLSLAAMLLITTAAEANGGYSRRTVVVREAPTTYVYERRPAPFIGLGIGHSVVELYDSPLRLAVDLNPFYHSDPLYIDPYVGGTIFGGPFIGRHPYHHRHFRHRGRR